MYEGVDAMGRGRQKAKQTKVARRLKYFSPDTDYDALQRELGGNGHHDVDLPEDSADDAPVDADDEYAVDDEADDDVDDDEADEYDVEYREYVDKTAERRG
jgi:hypothetical protein